MISSTWHNIQKMTENNISNLKNNDFLTFRVHTMVLWLFANARQALSKPVSD